MNRAFLAVTGGLLLGAGLAYAQVGRPPGPGNPTPGWEYGRLNCGPYSGNPPPTKPRTRGDCYACCWLQYQTNPAFTLANYTDCLTYCDWIHNVPGTVVTY